MPYFLADKFVIGVSTRALFDLEKEHAIHLDDLAHGRYGNAAEYRKYQVANEKIELSPGTAFPLIRSLLNFNKGRKEHEKLIEVVVISQNSADTSLRVFHSAKAKGLDVTRGWFTGGRSVVPYLKAVGVDLFLSANHEDVSSASLENYPAAAVWPFPKGETIQPEDEVRIAFDGDSTLFSDESDRVYAQSMEQYQAYEAANEGTPLGPGPLATVLKKLYHLAQREKLPLRTALITARNAPTETRPIHTLREWGVPVDEVAFLGGVEKTKTLKAFRPHIFFDNDHSHVGRAASSVPSAQPTVAKPPQSEDGSSSNLGGLKENLNKADRRSRKKDSTKVS